LIKQAIADLADLVPVIAERIHHHDHFVARAAYCMDHLGRAAIGGLPWLDHAFGAVRFVLERKVGRMDIVVLDELCLAIEQLRLERSRACVRRAWEHSWG
jgi:hypothetical protein